MKKKATPRLKSNRAYAITPTISIPQSDGSILLRAGQPIVFGEMVGTGDAAKILHMSQRWVAWQCEIGLFKTARRRGATDRGKWLIAREEVMTRRERN